MRSKRAIDNGTKSKKGKKSGGNLPRNSHSNSSGNGLLKTCAVGALLLFGGAALPNASAAATNGTNAPMLKINATKLQQQQAALELYQMFGRRLLADAQNASQAPPPPPTIEQLDIQLINEMGSIFCCHRICLRSILSLFCLIR